MGAWQHRNLAEGRPTPAQALKKLERYCAYQDRCHQEVRRKLYQIGLYGEDVDQVMATLIEGNFLDEERFARSYARGKHKMKKWGRVRIERELKSRQLSSYCIKAAMQELEQLDYHNTLKGLLQKRLDQQDDTLHPYARRQDIIQFGLRKGYEMEAVLALSRELVE